METELRTLIVEMATSNPTWGKSALLTNCCSKSASGFPPDGTPLHASDTRASSRSEPARMTFVRNHAKAIIACEFFVVVTARFQLFYVLFLMEIGTRRLLHFNVTRHPTADWTLQQFREWLRAMKDTVGLR